MKKILAGILVLTLVACLGTTISFAAGSVRGHHFEDINLDGICDNYTDKDGNGVCDNYGVDYIAGRRGCGSYRDADGEGVCDNYGGRGGRRSGAGCGRGCR